MFLAVLTLTLFVGVFASQPPYTVSQQAYDTTLQAIGPRNGSTVIALLHPPGSKVFGTVIVYQGVGQGGPPSSAPSQEQFLFRNSFNVLSFTAGIGLNPATVVSTVLRESAGYVPVRRILQTDPVLGVAITGLRAVATDPAQRAYHRSQGRLLVPALLRSIRRGLSPAQYRTSALAIAALAPELARRGLEKELRRFYISGHARFESGPFSDLQLAAALPGPLHVSAYSFAGVAALNLASLSRSVSRIALLAPFAGRIVDPTARDFAHLRALLGSLDLLNSTLGPASVPGRNLAPLVPAGKLVGRESVLRAVRESAGTLCVVAEDDDVIDARGALDVCRRVGGRAVVYPARLGLRHQIAPGMGGGFSKALLEQMVRFFVEGKVDEARFLVPN